MTDALVCEEGGVKTRQSRRCRDAVKEHDETQGVSNRSTAWFNVPAGHGHPGTGLATRPETLYYL